MRPTSSKTAIFAEALARQKSSAVTNQVTLSADFPAQNRFVEDTSKFVAAQCSRRAGKSNGLALRFFRTLETHPKAQCVYLALTRDSAKEIMWGVLQELNAQFNLGCTFTESKLEMKHPNGSKLNLYGADMKNFIKRLKGRKFPGVAIDEAQDFGSHLETLIYDTLSPALADYSDSWLALTGTPGPVPTGFFFDVTHNNKHGYSVHKWTLLDNIYMPNPAGFIKELCEKREWTDDNPTYRREYKNEWVLDAKSLWIQYSKSVNNYDALPAGHNWQYIMGVDLGFRDADAIAIIAWAETSPITYLVEELVAPKQGITELMDQMQVMEKKYNNPKIVMDEGGLGKKIAEELRRRHGLSINPADKIRKQENVELLNDAMRLGKFMAKSNTRFVADSYLVQIDWDKSTPNRIVVKKEPHSDIIDAVLYAFKESYAFSHRPEPVKPKFGSKEWADAQQDSMFEQELEGMLKEQELRREQGF